MSHRPVDWSPLAGSDPMPGEPDRVEELGRHYQRVASAISDAATKLRQIAERQDMQSKAVDAFRGTAREVADDISRALIGYAPELWDAQVRVRASDEVAPHLRQLQVQQRVLASAATYNVYDIGRNIVGLAPSSSAAQELHLPNTQQPVGTGARP